jgi:hypothetical protein
MFLPKCSLNMQQFFNIYFIVFFSFFGFWLVYVWRLGFISHCSSIHHSWTLHMYFHLSYFHSKKTRPFSIFIEECNFEMEKKPNRCMIHLFFLYFESHMSSTTCTRQWVGGSTSPWHMQHNEPTLVNNVMD